MVTLNGRKAWCSGAAVLSHALLTAWDEEDRQQLVAVALRSARRDASPIEGWQAVGMAATGSVEVLFDGAEGRPIGNPGDYLQRPGFLARRDRHCRVLVWRGAAASPKRLREHCANAQNPMPSPTWARSTVRCTAAAGVLRASA